jgi:hypothetical protein
MLFFGSTAEKEALSFRERVLLLNKTEARPARHRIRSESPQRKPRFPTLFRSIDA